MYCIETLRWPCYINEDITPFLEKRKCTEERRNRMKIPNTRSSRKSNQKGTHQIKWYDWSEWITAENCSDGCGKKTIRQTRGRSCNPDSICSMPYKIELSGGWREGDKIWYCENHDVCKGRHATESRSVSFAQACPCQTCKGKSL